MLLNYANCIKAKNAAYPWWIIEVKLKVNTCLLTFYSLCDTISNAKLNDKPEAENPKLTSFPSMQFRKFYKKKYTWYILILVLLIGAVIFYSSNKYAFINSKVGKLIAEKTDSLYTIAYDSISVDEAGGNLYIHNLRVTGDTILQKRYIAAGDSAAASILVDVFIPVLKVEGFKTAKALFSKQMVCNRIILSDPRVTIYGFPGVRSQRDFKNEGQQLYKQILGNFTLIQADSVSVINSEVVTMDYLTRDIKFHTFNTSLNLTDVLIDSAHYYDTSRTLFCKQIALATDRVTIGDNPVIAEATKLSFDTRSRLLSILAVSYNGIKNGKNLSGKAENIAVTGINASGPLDSLNVEVGTALFKNASVMLKSKVKENEKEAKNKRGERLLTGWIKSFKMKELQTGDISLKMVGNKQEQSEVSIGHSKVALADLVLDTTTIMDKSIIDNTGNIVISNELISIKSKDGLYTFSLAGLRVNKAARTIFLREFAVKPFLGEAAFAKKVKVQKDRYDIRIRNVTATKVNFEKLLDEKIEMDMLRTSGSSVKIYRDVSMPLDSVKKMGNAPHQMLMKADIPINIRRFVFANGLVEYKERNGLSDTSGAVRFENSTVTITNINNAKVADNKIMNMEFSSALLGKVPLNVNIKFYLNNIAEGRYKVTSSGKERFSATVLNPIIVPMGLMRIDKGTVNGISFNFIGDNRQAKGFFLVEYNDLKISLMKRDKGNGKFNKKGITSFLANVIVKNANPSGNKLRKANVVYTRDEYKSFFNMIWKFAFVGIKDIMGAKL